MSDSSNSLRAWLLPALVPVVGGFVATQQEALKSYFADWLRPCRLIVETAPISVGKDSYSITLIPIGEVPKKLSLVTEVKANPDGPQINSIMIFIPEASGNRLFPRETVEPGRSIRKPDNPPVVRIEFDIKNLARNADYRFLVSLSRSVTKADIAAGWKSYAFVVPADSEDSAFNCKADALSFLERKFGLSVVQYASAFGLLVVFALVAAFLRRGEKT